MPALTCLDENREAMTRTEPKSLPLLNALLFTLTTCLGYGPLLGESTFHRKVGWKAEDFFQDPQVIGLCEAIAANDLESMGRLIKAGVNVNAKGAGNMTPLLWAFPDDRPDRFEMLLEAGANPNVKITTDLGVPNGFEVGDSVTHKAAASYFPEHFRLVMEHGGDPDVLNSRGETPIFSVIKGMGADK